MTYTDQIIEEYKNSDFEKRLDYFLRFRSLRNEFIEIDKSNGYDILSLKRPSKKGRRMLHKLHLML